MISLPASEASPERIRAVERESIQMFLAAQHQFFKGTVIDYGCGRQPYRNLVESFGCQYVGFDTAAFPANVSGEDVWPSGDAEQPWPGEKYETVLCTQVVQYAYAGRIVAKANDLLALGGHLILTGPTCWDEVEPDDHERLTLSGIRKVLEHEGFEVLVAERRAEVDCKGFKFPLGYGIVGRAS